MPRCRRGLFVVSWLPAQSAAAELFRVGNCGLWSCSGWEVSRGDRGQNTETSPVNWLFALSATSREPGLAHGFLDRRMPASINPLAFIHHVRLAVRMPVCTNNVRKRKARRIKNDRLQAAKIAAKAKI